MVAVSRRQAPSALVSAPFWVWFLLVLLLATFLFVGDEDEQSSYQSILDLQMNDTLTSRRSALVQNISSTTKEEEEEQRRSNPSLLDDFIAKQQFQPKSQGRLKLQRRDGSAVRIQVNACWLSNLFEMENTISTCFDRSNTSFVLQNRTSLYHLHPSEFAAEVDVLLFCQRFTHGSIPERLIDTKECPKKRSGFVFVHPRMKAQRGGQRIMGGLNGLKGKSKTLNNKKALCALSNRLRNEHGVEIAPPCFEVPGVSNYSEIEHYMKQYPFWIYKPGSSTGGGGIQFVKPKQILEKNLKPGAVQAYIHNPLLMQRRPGLYIKLDLRIYGVMTAVQPMRLFVSWHGLFRAADPNANFTMNVGINENKMMHVTNSGKLIHAGIFENLDVDYHADKIPYDSSMETNFSNAGTLNKFWRIVQSRGLDKKAVWKNILALFPLVYGGGQEWMLPGCQSRDIGTEGLCSQEFIPFFSDVVIDEHGNAKLLETHPECSLKNCHPAWGFEMTGCYHPIVTEFASRPAIWGTLSMGFARFIEPEFQTVAEGWILEKLNKGVHSPVHRCKKASQTLQKDGCLSLQAIDILVEMAHEDFLACKLGLQDAFYVLKDGMTPNDVILDDGRLRHQLLSILDNATSSYYTMYNLLELPALASRYSQKSCPSSSFMENTMYFGHGEDHGCQPFERNNISQLPALFNEYYATHGPKGNPNSVVETLGGWPNGPRKKK